MNVILYNDEDLLPKALGAHVFVYTGPDRRSDDKSAGTVTEIFCTYVVNGAQVDFRKNTESVHLRFEDAILWAVRYARTFGIADVHAVFKLSRAIDPRFIQKIGPADLVDKSGQALSRQYFNSKQRNDLFSRPARRTTRHRASLLSRNSALRVKLDRCRVSLNRISTAH